VSGIRKSVSVSWFYFYHFKLVHFCPRFNWHSKHRPLGAL
jgi:hypothetical protein